MIQFRPPSMRETTPTGQINELRRYLFQLVEQLNYMAGLEQNKAEAVKIETPADIPGGGGGSGEIPEASEIPYDNAVSGIEADNVQDAIDTIDQMLDGKVDIVAGKGLSTNDYTDGEAQKVLEALTYTAQSLTDAQKQQARDNIGAGTGGGGVSELAELDDVSLSSPSDNQVLGYNATSQKWENKTLSSSEHNYSTTEQVVGTWIDGKPLYERVIAIPNTTAINNSFTYNHGIANYKMGKISEAFLYNTSDKSTMLLPLASNDNSVLTIRINASQITFYGTNSFSAANIRTLFVIVQYTKTTD